MNKETYEALKRIIKFAYHESEVGENIKLDNDLVRVDDWIDEVAKEYEGTCNNCGESYGEMNKFKSESGEDFNLCPDCDVKE